VNEEKAECEEACEKNQEVDSRDRCVCCSTIRGCRAFHNSAAALASKRKAVCFADVTLFILLFILL